MKLKFFLVSLSIFNLIFAVELDDFDDHLQKNSGNNTSGWNADGKISSRFNQNHMSNWSTGSKSVISFNGSMNLSLGYKKNKFMSETALDLDYGLLKKIKQGDLIKSDDRFEIDSKYGFKTGKHWYYVGAINFESQMFNGYKHEGDSLLISAPLAPAYITSSLGFNYQYGNNFSLLISPTTVKITTVFNKTLSEKGLFGVKKGSRYKGEFGGYIKTKFKKEIVKNIKINNKLKFFSKYFYKTKNVNIDANWEVLLSLNVNEYISVDINTVLIYKDEIKNTQSINIKKKLQFKENFGIGFNYDF